MNVSEVKTNQISSIVDTGTVQTDNLQFDGNTISSTDTNGNIILSPDGTGKVGIGMTPLHMLDITPVSGSNALHIDGDVGTSVAQVHLEGSTNGIKLDVNDNSTSYYGLSIVNSDTTDLLYVQNDGNIGIGTNTPYARVHINGTGSGSGLVSASYRRFDYSTGIVAYTGGWSTADMSIWAAKSIISRESLVGHSNGTFSDMRIKNNIVDIQDSEALEKIRNIKPRKYEYKDVVMKGTKTVWGFIAQEVAEVLDYSTDLMEKEIPNIYANATVQGKTLTFENFDTSNLVRDNEGNICKKLFLMSEKDTEVIVTIDNIISRNSISILDDIEQKHLFENIIFVYGQYVKDFHVLKKDAIFTVTVAAVQEIDRIQQEDNERILELENENSALQSEVNTLKQQMALVMHKLGL